MNGTLQRSSVSFRRQGSSGRVWDNLHIDRKASEALSGPLSGQLLSMSVDKSQKLSLKNIEKEAIQEKENKEISNFKSSPSPMPSSKSDNKNQRCNVLSLFRSCMGSPTL
ncbi:hypothetical protein MANES_15G178100v8 [Manihot esculenta]|uniref:Uncharacterized protein n=1 Tax=Manihot esculenta TaxID=3983 RepID=A0A2C9UH01_MANES|nr:hypothetical protein MANES_15G178100v8 [Manihot esculenta]